MPPAVTAEPVTVTHRGVTYTLPHILAAPDLRGPIYPGPLPADAGTSLSDWDKRPPAGFRDPGLGHCPVRQSARGSVV